MPRLAVLGHPVAHSRSPAMQSAALAALGLGEEWTYEAIDVAPEDFEARVRAMAAEGFVGANVTVPHKEAALALADVPSEMAKEIGAANTLALAEDSIQAHNTDAPGLLAALPEPAGMRALVLGAGGAARAAVWGLRTAGAAVDIWNRTGARADRIHGELNDAIAVRDSIEVKLNDEVVVPHSTGAEGAGSVVTDPDQADYRVIVNTAAVGLRGEDPFAHLPLDPAGFGPDQVVVDMVYGGAPSPLLAAAAAAGAATVDGLEILVQQGALSLRIWTGRDAPLEVMRDAARG